MRMRFKPYAGPELDAFSACKREPAKLRGEWAHQYKRSKQPLHLELGCGKGGFISQLSVKNKEVNYLGIDITDKVLILAKRNIESAFENCERQIDNVLITLQNIELIGKILCKDDNVQRIYINFCNPWNRKSGQKKHRLTHTRQLMKYREFLSENAQIYFKCDNDNLYEDTLIYFEEAGFEIIKKTWDLHSEENFFDHENIVTEHERMFTQQGLKTHAAIARMKNTEV